MTARRPPLRLALLPALLLALAGCGGGGGDAPPDAGPDAAPPDGAPPADTGPPPPFSLAPCAEPSGGHAPLATRCGHFVDDAGRVVLLRGVNARVEGLFDVTFDDGREPLEPIPDFGAEDVARMRAMGFNVLRLPINWSGIEPTDESPPAYDADYLARLDEVLDLCRAGGLLVLVDFHEDAFSKEIGEDGAPLWAIQPPPEMLLEGPLTDLDARRQSAQVLAAFGTFFGDEEPGPSLRARFAAMAAAVATHLEGDDAVVGYDLFNEPIGSDAEVLRLNQVTAEAIAAADPQKLVFFEPPVLQRNLLDRSGRPPGAFPVAGGVYAPHVYSLAFGGFATDEDRRTFTLETLRTGNRTARDEARLWGTPLFVGEYGYDPFGIRPEEYFAFQHALQDEYMASAALWVWKEDSQGSWGLHDWDEDAGAWVEREVVRGWVARPGPRAIAGWPTEWRYDPATKRLVVRYEGDAAVTAPTVLFVPEPADFAASFSVTCDGAAVEVTRDAATGEAAVPCGGPGAHEIVLEGA